jgi:radical SAM protein with 4Fe4S-binding SPASM domain
MNLLEIFATRRNKFSFAILTNGSLINKELAQRLAGLNPAFIQVSIEGNEVTHDSIRGQGNYRRTIEAVKNLVSNKIRTLISFTAHSDNFREFSHVAKLGRELGVSRVWADRMIPLGSGSGKKVLTPDETHEFFRIMHRSRLLARFLQLFALGRTEIAMHRALQHLVGGGRAYHCTAGDSLITVQPNGDLLPCRRMPVTVGNLLETPLEMLYRDSDLFQELRDQARISKGCEKCSFNKSCSGGLKCLSYAVKGDPFSADPGCWKGSKQLIARSRT